MVVFPNAKINLGLHITEKRSDGFHNIESVFYPIGISDALELIPSKVNEEVSLEVYKQIIPGNPQNNLLVKAFHLFKEKVPTLLNVAFHLIKNIPMGGGIGGGSSNATFALRLLNDFSPVKLNEETLFEMAFKLGSDCPFFLENKPMLVTGRGETMEACPAFLKGKYLVLLNSKTHISTKDAYLGIVPKKARTPLLENLCEPIETWKENVVNDFENSVFKKFAELNSLKEQLYNNGALYASLTGTGGCLYGVYSSKPIIESPIKESICWEGML
jgi:4-diphosphocytidyl-2-C-methyl-D-erythritol kinase